jgi:hypothetical protein
VGRHKLARSQERHRLYTSVRHCWTVMVQ